jgi:hypothetical protein
MSVPLFLRDEKTGLVSLNELKKYVLPWQLVPQNLGNNTGTLAVPGNAVRNIVLEPDQNGPFEGMYLTCDVYGSPLILVRLHDAGYNRDLMNRDVLVQTIMTPIPGAQDPFILPETFWIEQRQSLIMTFTDFSALANSVRPVFHGRKFFLRQARAGLADKFVAKRRQQRKITTPYFYTTDQAVTLAAAAVATRANITISDEGHFVAHKITFWSDGPFEYRLIDGENGQSTSGTVFINSTSGAGTAARPYILPEPWFIEKNRQLILEMNNLFAGGANRVFFTITGRRVYDDQYRDIV